MEDNGKIEEALRLTNQLFRQLEENTESFHWAIGGEINAIYQKNNSKAIENCKELKQILLQVIREG